MLHRMFALGTMILVLVLGGTEFSSRGWAMGERAASPPAASSTSLSEKGTVDIQVDGLACPLCAYTLREKLAQRMGKGTFEIRIEEGILRIQGRGAKTSVAEVEKLIRSAGFTPRGVVRDASR